MSTSSPPRAPAPVGPARPTAPGRPLVRLCLGVVLAISVGWPARSDGPVAITTARAAAAERRADSIVPAASRSDPFASPAKRAVVRVRPLDPQPPEDQRDAPDPFVLSDRGHYVLYSTQVGFFNVPVSTSPDLRHWSAPAEALPLLPAWALWGRTWAPGAVRNGATYVLYFAAHHGPSGRQCIGVATSSIATGPFVSHAPLPLVCQTELGGSIDPQPFVDRDGALYLLWKADGNAIGRRSILFGQRLTPDGLGLTGPRAALIASDAAWEQPLIENPALVATEGDTYLLLYSGGWWESAGYAVGGAICASPLGPCTKVTRDRPLLGSAGDEAGPGGASVVGGASGGRWLAYHAWRPEAIGYENGGVRSLRFASLAWLDGQPVITR